MRKAVSVVAVTLMCACGGSSAPTALILTSPLGSFGPWGNPTDAGPEWVVPGSTGTATLGGAVNVTLTVLAVAYASPAEVSPADGGYDGGVFVFPASVLISIYPADYPGDPEFSSVVYFPGASLQPGTFTDANTSWAVTGVQTPSPADGGFAANWGADFESSDPSGETGTFSLTISSVGPGSWQDGGSTEYANPHGQLTGTLTAAGPNATGTVNVDVTF